MSKNFKEIYVEIAEQTANSRKSFKESMEPLENNVKTVVNVQTSGDDSFSETDISEIDFAIANLTPANSTWRQSRDASLSDSIYTPVVLALNNFVKASVLGKGDYSDTLYDFVTSDCDWTDPSVDIPVDWIELLVTAGFEEFASLLEE